MIKKPEEATEETKPKESVTEVTPKEEAQQQQQQIAITETKEEDTIETAKAEEAKGTTTVREQQQQQQQVMNLPGHPTGPAPVHPISQPIAATSSPATTTTTRTTTSVSSTSININTNEKRKREHRRKDSQRSASFMEKGPGGLPLETDPSPDPQTAGGPWPMTPSVWFSRGDPTPLVNAIREAEGRHAWGSPELVDYWTTRELPREAWAFTKKGALRKELRRKSLISVKAAVKAGYTVECSALSTTHKYPELDRAIVSGAEDDYPYYAEFVAPHPHTNYVAAQVPCVISIESPHRGSSRGAPVRAVVRTASGTKRLLLPPKGSLKALVGLSPFLGSCTIKKAASTALPAALVKYEAANIVTTHKIGVLYCGPGECTENELFGATAGSPAYEEFLAFLGDRITLQGWKQYRGGLDVTSNTTGKE